MSKAADIRGPSIATIQERLDKFMDFAKLTLIDLAASVEDFLFAECRRATVASCLRVAATFATDVDVDSIESVFYVGERSYHLTLTELSPGQLMILIENIDRSANDRVRNHAKMNVSGSGQISTVLLRVSESFARYADQVVQEVVDLLTSGYRWLEQTADLLLDTFAFDTGRELYSAVRMNLPDNVSKEIVLIVFCNEDGSFIFDGQKREQVKQALRERASIAVSSPIAQSITLVTTSMAKELSLTWPSLSKGNAMIGQVLNAPYSRELSDIYEAERNALSYSHSTFCARPLVRQEKTAILGAVYPARLDEYIEPQIEEIGYRCRAVLERRDTSLRKSMRRLKTLVLLREKGSIFQSAAQFVGIATREWFKA